MITCDSDAWEDKRPSNFPLKFISSKTDHSPAAVLKIQVKGRICSLYFVLLSTIIEWGPGLSSPGRREIIPPPMLASGVKSTPSNVILIEVVSISGILKNDTAITSSPGTIVDPGSGDNTRKSLFSKSPASTK